MGQRLELQALLESLLGSRNVYFQPPSNIQMQYPCIVYIQDNMHIAHAGNKPYRHKNRYQITVIARNPDSELHEKIALLPTASYDRFYSADNLNHDVYTVYF